MRRCGRGRGKAREDKTDKHGTCSVAVHLQLVLHRQSGKMAYGITPALLLFFSGWWVGEKVGTKAE